MDCISDVQQSQKWQTDSQLKFSVVLGPMILIHMVRFCPLFYCCLPQHISEVPKVAFLLLTLSESMIYLATMYGKSA